MVVIKHTTATDADFVSLVVDLNKEFWVRYPDTQHNFEPYNKVDETARVVVAYQNNKPVGCGCFRPMTEPGTIEIKRMYVTPESRGFGIARLILQDLEQWAIEEGFIQSKLETGINQPEAITVYKRSDYQPIPNYPPYTNIAESICMAKRLN
jgi:putative acetyltransferase